ncbi:sugar transferase [Ramlibacter sp. GTP1]|uniref:Sugar transferase n=1 Tax=Ramlibacter albus TaxID=2079448 RepID=A0A923M9T8_9BURK|nr:sugar transferase [Ramlibacter albus]
MQRLADIVLSAAALLVLSPLLLPVALLLRLTGEGEVFYVQPRVGMGGREFGVLKFATMLKDSPNIGAGTVTVRDDPRILPVGGFLRKTKINELPQLLNILFGDMSVVGPRPLVRKAFETYDPQTQEIIKRLRPGLSGLGSMVFRNEEEILHGSQDPLAFYYRVVGPYKGQLERWYYENASLAVYIKVIVVTAILVVRPDTGLVFRVFKDLPEPPPELRDVLLGT